MKISNRYSSSTYQSRLDTGNIRDQLTSTARESDPSTSIELSSLWQPKEFYGTNGADSFTGSFGKDTMYGSGGPDSFDGKSGTDTVDYSQSGSAVNVLLDRFSQQGGDAEGDILRNVENVVGSDFNDVLGGTSGSNRLEGGAGDDTFFLDGGADQIIGGSGNDLLMVTGDGSTIDLANGTGSGGDADGDFYNGIEQVGLGREASNNKVIGSNADETVTNLGDNNDIDLGGGNDTLNYSSATASGELDGGSGYDTLNFNGPTILPSKSAGGQGVVGTSGVNVDLESGTFERDGQNGQGEISGFEHVIGTDVDDEFIDNRDDNTFTGGSGADTFAFNHDGSGETDVITDFEVGLDTIDLSGIEGISWTLWFNESLPFEIEDVGGLLDIVGIDAPDPLESWVEQDGDNVVIHTDFQAGDSIVLEGVSMDDLSQSDFIFAS